MNKLELILIYRYELMAIMGFVGSTLTDSKILLSISIFILIIGLVGMTAKIIAIIVSKDLVQFFNEAFVELDKKIDEKNLRNGNNKNQKQKNK